MEQKFSGTKVWNFGCTSPGCPNVLKYGNDWKICSICPLLVGFSFSHVSCMVIVLFLFVVNGTSWFAVNKKLP